MTTKDVLIEARTLIAKGWTRLDFAQDANGRPTGYWKPDAAKFCIRGAVYRACGHLSGLCAEGQGESLLRHCLPNLPAAEGLADWNDAPGRTQEEVLALFDRAIASCD